MAPPTAEPILYTQKNCEWRSESKGCVPSQFWKYQKTEGLKWLKVLKRLKERWTKKTKLTKRAKRFGKSERIKRTERTERTKGTDGTEESGGTGGTDAPGHVLWKTPMSFITTAWGGPPVTSPIKQTRYFESWCSYQKLFQIPLFILRTIWQIRTTNIWKKVLHVKFAV